jgi:hypothetical protein
MRVVSVLMALSAVVGTQPATPHRAHISPATDVTSDNHDPSWTVDVARQRAPTSQPRAEAGTAQRRRIGQDAHAVKKVAPLTADGHPDLQGVWMNDSATPLERPKGLEGRVLLTDLEVIELQRRADRIFSNDDNDAGIGDNVFLAAFANVDRYKFAAATAGALAADRRVFDNRTSLIVDPPDGRIPFTSHGLERRAAQVRSREDPPGDPEALPNEVRCLTYEVPRLVGGLLTFLQIVQTPGQIALVNEYIHEVRIIPLSRAPHLPNSIRRWSGDSRGHWEQDTLVIDTTNFTPLNTYQGSDENLHLTERLTRRGPAAIDYEITLDDSTAYTRPWTARTQWKQTAKQMFEDACHEGNYSMIGILRGARAQEKP